MEVLIHLVIIGYTSICAQIVVMGGLGMHRIRLCNVTLLVPFPTKIEDSRIVIAHNKMRDVMTNTQWWCWSTKRGQEREFSYLGCVWKHSSRSAPHDNRQSATKYPILL